MQQQQRHNNIRQRIYFRRQPRHPYYIIFMYVPIPLRKNKSISSIISNGNSAHQMSITLLPFLPIYITCLGNQNHVIAHVAGEIGLPTLPCQS